MSKTCGTVPKPYLNRTKAHILNILGFAERGLRSKPCFFHLVYFLAVLDALWEVH